MYYELSLFTEAYILGDILHVKTVVSDITVLILVIFSVHSWLETDIVVCGKPDTVYMHMHSNAELLFQPSLQLFIC